MADDTTLDIEPGDRLAVAKIGPVEVESVSEDGTLRVLDREGSLQIDRAELQEKARALVDADTAEDIRSRLGSLGAPNEAERPYHRKKAYRAAMKDNDFEHMATTLEGIYRHPDPDFPEERFQERLEHAVFQEMAWVLDESRDALIREARRAADRAVPARDHSAALAEAGVPPEVDGWRALGAFATDGKVLAGESSNYAMHVRPGAWFAYERTAAERDEAEMLACVHADCVEQRELLHERRVEMSDTYAIDGATSWVVDTVLTEAPEFDRALFGSDEAIVSYGGFGPRGAKVYAGSDGSGSLQVAGVDDDGSVIDVRPSVSRPTPTLALRGEVEPTVGEITYIVLDVYAY